MTTMEHTLELPVLPARSTCVVVPDATRPIDYDEIVRPLIQVLCDAGSDVSLLVGLGLHRRMTPSEIAPLRRIASDRNLELFEHDPLDSELVAMGEATGLPDSAPNPLPVFLSPHLLAARRLICVGTVEPHQYAGFSGGIKAISIGCAGEATISAMHGLSLLRDQGTRLGAIENNPFQQCLWRIAADLDDVLALQIVPGTSENPTEIFFGEVQQTFRQACAVASQAFFHTVDHQVDWLHLPVPAVKAVNFYQASRAATYAALVDDPAVRRGGLIVVEAHCREKMGDGTGEGAFAEAMNRGRQVLLEELATRSAPIRGGQQRAYVLARACQRNTIALVGAPPMEELKPMGIKQFDSLEEALKSHGSSDRPGMKIDDIFRRIPRFRPRHTN